jgi:hypothetical protein
MRKSLSITGLRDPGKLNDCRLKQAVVQTLLEDLEA